MRTFSAYVKVAVEGFPNWVIFRGSGSSVREV